MKNLLILALILGGVFSFAEDKPMPSAGESHAKDVMGIRFAPGGKTLYSTGADSQIFGWDPETGLRKVVFYGLGSAAFAIALSDDGKLLAAAEGFDNAVSLWDAEAGKKIKVFYAHKQPVQRLAFSPDGRLLASAGKDGLAAVHDAERGKKVSVRTNLTGIVWDIAFTSDGSRYACAAGKTIVMADGVTDKGLRLWMKN